MSAEKIYYNKDLLAHYTRELLARMNQSIFPSTPEWRAWVKEWREIVPLTAEPERENSEWRAKLGDARRAVQEAQAALNERLDAIAGEYRVKVVDYGDGGSEFDVDEYEPPHRPTYRTKDGAPPAPPMWPSGKTVRFVRHDRTDDPQ